MFGMIERPAIFKAPVGRRARRLVPIVYVLLDGVGDLPHPDLGGRTPLEVASAPALDSLARAGIQGRVVSVGEGIAPESDIAVFNMLGYSFEGERYPGRGVIEALGLGIDFRDGDLALRGNLATLAPDGTVSDRRAGRRVLASEAEQVARELSGIELSVPGASALVVPAVGHRVAVRIRAPGSLSAGVTNTDPAYASVGGMGVALEGGGPLRILESRPQDADAGLAARLINEFSEKAAAVLARSAVNEARKARSEPGIDCVLLRDAGNTMPAVRPIKERHGARFASVVDMPVEVGIAGVLGMDALEAGGPSDYSAKASAAASALDSHDAVYVHLKGPDEFGHDGDAQGKARSIEEIDSEFFAPLVEALRGRAAVAVSADHSTPCIKMAHTDDPVPLLVSGGAAPSDDTSRMTEAEALSGSLGMLPGARVLDEALRLTRR